MGLFSDFVLLTNLDALHQPQERGTVEFLKLGMVADDGPLFVCGLLVLLGGLQLGGELCLLFQLAPAFVLVAVHQLNAQGHQHDAFHLVLVGRHHHLVRHIVPAVRLASQIRPALRHVVEAAGRGYAFLIQRPGDFPKAVPLQTHIENAENINLKSRVETRMKISVMTSTGDDDLINPEEKGDLEYRKQQLKRLQEEVVDMEDMSTGISIMDLGLNEFRLELLDYIKTHGDLAKRPKGLHAVVPATEENPEGVIFVLRNINNSVNIDNQNRIHPFYMVYISVDGEVVCDYLNPKKLLDTIRLLCRGKSEPVIPLCAKFNEETDDGRNFRPDECSVRAG